MSISRPSYRDRTGPNRSSPPVQKCCAEMMSVSVGDPENRCRTTIAEQMVETRAELPFFGDQVGLFRAQPGRPRRTCNSRGVACLSWGIDNNLTRKLSSADPVQIAMLKGVTAGTVNLGLALWQGGALPEPGIMAAAGVTGFLGYGVSLVLFVMGLRYLGSARTGAYFSLAPFIGAVLDHFSLG